jgi:hypothetical protein
LLIKSYKLFKLQNTLVCFLTIRILMMMKFCPNVDGYMVVVICF